MAFPTTTNAYAGSLAITRHQVADGCQQGSTAQPKNTSQHPNKNGTPKQVVSARGINVLGQVLPSRQPFKEVGRLLKDTPRGLMGLFIRIMTVKKSNKEPRTRHNCVPGTTNSQDRHRCRQNQTDKREPPKHTTRHSNAHKDRGGNPMTKQPTKKPGGADSAGGHTRGCRQTDCQTHQEAKQIASRYRHRPQQRTAQLQGEK